MRACACPGCEIPVKDSHVLCIDHFKALPRDVQKDVRERVNGWHAPNSARELVAIYFNAHKEKV